MVKWLEHLDYGAESCRKVMSSRLGFANRRLENFFELGKDKAAKGEGWAPPFISCAQDTVGL